MYLVRQYGVETSQYKLNWDIIRYNIYKNDLWAKTITTFFPPLDLDQLLLSQAIKPSFYFWKIGLLGLVQHFLQSPLLLTKNRTKVLLFKYIKDFHIRPTTDGTMSHSPSFPPQAWPIFLPIKPTSLYCHFICYCSALKNVHLNVI